MSALGLDAVTTDLSIVYRVPELIQDYHPASCSQVDPHRASPCTDEVYLTALCVVSRCSLLQGGI